MSSMELKQFPSKVVRGGLFCYLTYLPPYSLWATRQRRELKKDETLSFTLHMTMNGIRLFAEYHDKTTEEPANGRPL